MLIKRIVILNLIAFILFLIALVLTSLTVATILINKSGPLSENTTVVIPSGASVYEISEILSKKNVIEYPRLFWLLAKIQQGKPLKAGEYYFTKNITLGKVFDTIKYGKILIHLVTFPEGMTNYQIVDKINHIEILTGDIVESYPEGQLLPDTYSYIYGDRRQQLLDRMHKKSKEILAKLWLERMPNLPYKKPEDALVMASIIEKETNKDSERARVAGVFINRLKKKMKLQADPTVIYAITEGKYILDRKLTKRDLLLPSKFNTYYSSGLPPRPIANPGVASIKAALNPLITNELYFVVNETGNHSFSSTLEQHNENVRNYRKLENR